MNSGTWMGRPGCTDRGVQKCTSNQPNVNPELPCEKRYCGQGKKWNQSQCKCVQNQQPPPSKGDCKDDDTRCAGWAASGECSNNPNYMLESCKKSCKECSDEMIDDDMDYELPASKYYEKK